jgi:hypothetical protein
MPPEGVFGRDEILDSLDAVAALLAERNTPQGVLIVVGGSYLALHGLRDATADVATVTRIVAAIREAIEQVAAQRDLHPNWLNDKAAGYAPPGLTEEMCDVLYEHPSLRVLGPPADYVFLMKLLAARVSDFDDMIALWPRCTFRSPEEAVQRFVAAYPHAPEDPDLAEYVGRIAAAATAL